MHVYKAEYLIDDKSDNMKQIKVSECYVSDDPKLVFDKVMDDIKNIDGDFLSLVKYDLVVGVLEKKRKDA